MTKPTYKIDVILSTRACSDGGWRICIRGSSAGPIKIDVQTRHNGNVAEYNKKLLLLRTAKRLIALYKGAGIINNHEQDAIIDKINQSVDQLRTH